MATQAVDRGVSRSYEAPIGGVCAGLAERFDLDPIVVRILAVFIALLTAGLGVVAYFALWARLPRSVDPDIPYEVKPESAESSSFGSVDCSTGRAASRSGSKRPGSISLLARMAIAIGLALLFLLVAIGLSPLVPGTEWWQFWPLALVITGLCLIVIPVPSAYEAAWHALGVVVMSVAASLLPVSLDLVMWETLPYAFSRAWPLLVVAVAVFGVGVRRKSDVLMIGASFIVVAFCVLALTLYVLPSGAQVLMLHLPDGRLLKIALLGS